MNTITIINFTLLSFTYLVTFNNLVTAEDPEDVEALNMPSSKLFEKDIVLTNYEMDNLGSFLNGTLYTGLTRNAMRDTRKKWPGGVVPYTFANGHFRSQWQRTVIQQAMNEYHRKTCIKFKPRSNERGYIQFVEGGGCSSMVGRTGNAQRVTLGRGCVNLGTVIHELMHAVGFWHEQSRADRDQYVYIDHRNIISGMAYNFEKYDLNKISHLGTAYDYCSVMHYPRNAFSRNGRDTIVPRKATRCTLGQKGGFSANDIKKINILYQCGGGVKPTPKPTPTGTCRDDNTGCAGWAARGECQKNPGYMLKSCRKSCKQCSTTTKPTPTPSKCVDKNAQCSSWARGGECTKNPGYMHPNCAKSCNTCGTTPTTNCKDNNTHCSGWARGGYCTSNAYVSKNCKKSCGVC